MNRPFKNVRTRVGGAVRRRLPVRRIIPNVITLLALCIGLTSIQQGLAGNFELAVYCILAAAVLDATDGRVARLLHAESVIGEQLDSLADFINFGVAPALVIYAWALQPTGRLGWAVLLIYSMCCALRLARFHAASDDGDASDKLRRFFIGVPAPAGGGLMLLPLFLSFAGLVDLRDAPAFVMVNSLLVGFLMVSRLPSFAPDALLSPTIRREYMGFAMLAVACVLVMVLTFPWPTMIACAGLYFASLPLSYRAYRRVIPQDSPDVKAS